VTGKGIISAQSHAYVLTQKTTQDSRTSQIFALFGRVKCDARNVSQSPNTGPSHWCSLYFIVPSTTQVYPASYSNTIINARHVTCNKIEMNPHVQLYFFLSLPVVSHLNCGPQTSQ